MASNYWNTPGRSPYDTLVFVLPATVGGSEDVVVPGVVTVSSVAHIKYKRAPNQQTDSAAVVPKGTMPKEFDVKVHLISQADVDAWDGIVRKLGITSPGADRGPIGARHPQLHRLGVVLVLVEEVKHSAPNATDGMTVSMKLIASEDPAPIKVVADAKTAGDEDLLNDLPVDPTQQLDLLRASGGPR